MDMRYNKESALSAEDKVVMMLVVDIHIHTLAKVVIIPVDARVSANILIIK